MPTSLLSLFLISFFLTACNTPRNSVYWVSGMKTECAAGAGKRMCLNVHRGDDPGADDWENFYAGIEGFEFEEGYLKKIEVREENLDPATVPADASSIKYTLVKELDRRVDPRYLANGTWQLIRLNDAPVNRMVPLPTLDIDLVGMRISGSGGCNTYSGPIERLAGGELRLGDILSTYMSCANKHIERDYHAAIREVKTYKVEGGQFILYGENEKPLLTYMKLIETKANPRLHDIWALREIEGAAIDREKAVPTMELYVEEKKVLGNDGCNQYTGKIAELSGSTLVFGPLAATKKMCPEMQMTNRFNAAMRTVREYQLDGLFLRLLNDEGKSVLTFQKVD